MKNFKIKKKEIFRNLFFIQLCQADRFLKEIIKIMDDTEDLGQKVCFTFNEEVTQMSKITI